MSVTATKPDLFALTEDLPLRRYIQTQRHRVNRLKDKMNRSAYYDQYAGKSDPYNYSLWYGPIGLQTPRRVGTTGFLGLAPLVDPSVFLLPRTGNIQTGRDGTFMWHSVNATSYISWTRTAQTAGWPVTGPINSQPAGDLFSSVQLMNGGGQVLQNLSDIAWGRTTTSPLDAPAVYWEIELYDRKRGRSITDGKLPAEAFFGGSLGFKELNCPKVFEPDTEIEPRLYVNQARIPGADTDTAVYEAARVAFFVNIIFKGEMVFEVRTHD